jgi:hypothetical protein
MLIVQVNLRKENYLKYQHLVLSGIFSLISANSLAFARGAAPTPDPEANDAILYRNGYATALAKNAEKKLGFYLKVDKQGSGRFVDYGTNVQHLMANGVPEDWSARKEPVKSEAVWLTLTKDKAREVWGEPHGTAVRPGMVVFDASGVYDGENNLYHVDLQFDQADKAFRYRVRGIGITEPKWIGLSKDGHTEVMSETPF